MYNTNIRSPVLAVTTQTKSSFPSLKLNLYEIGTDNAFNVVRTITHSRAFGHREFCYYTSHVCQLGDIWTRNSEWRRASIYIGDTWDHKSTMTWNTSGVGRTLVREVDMEGVNEGRRKSFVGTHATATFVWRPLLSSKTI